MELVTRLLDPLVLFVGGPLDGQKKRVPRHASCYSCPVHSLPEVGRDFSDVMDLVRAYKVVTYEARFFVRGHFDGMRFIADESFREFHLPNE